MKNTQKGFSNFLIIILAVLLILIIGILYFSNSSGDQDKVVQTGFEKTPEVKSIKDELGLKYMVYNGSGDKNLIAKFNGSSLKEIQSGSQTLGENFADTGDANINVAEEVFVLDKKSDVYIKLVTDNDVAAYIFKTDTLHKFLGNMYPSNNPSAVQNPKDFLPLQNIQSSYTEITLEAGNYSLVFVPNQKAVQLDTTIKIK